MDKVLNLELMKNPVNWVIIVLMMLIASMAVSYIFASATQGNN